MGHRNAFYHILMENLVQQAVFCMARVYHIDTFNLCRRFAYQGVVTSTLYKVQPCCHPVAGTMTVGTGRVEVTLLDGVEHADVDGTDLHIHRVTRLLERHLLKGHHMAAQTVKNAELNIIDIGIDARQDDAHRAIGILGDSLGDDGIVVSPVETRNSHVVLVRPVLKARQRTCQLHYAPFLERSDFLRDAAIVAGTEPKSRQS